MAFEHDIIINQAPFNSGDLDLAKKMAELIELIKAGNQPIRRNNFSLMAILPVKTPTMCAVADRVAARAKPGQLYFEAEKRFIHLDAFFVKNSDDSLDALSDYDGKPAFNNRLCYLQDHPAVYLANFCDLTQFVSEKGSYIVPDLRKDIYWDDENTSRSSETQMHFVLYLNE